MTELSSGADPRAREFDPKRIAIGILRAPPIVLTASALAGLGLARDLSPLVAFAAGISLAVLPPAGLTRRSPSRSPAQTWACYLWCAIVLYGLPSYFPGERAEATARGLRAATSWVGEPIAETIAEAGAGWVDLLGDDPVRQRTPDPGVATPEPRRRPVVSPTLEPPRPRPDGTLILPYEQDQTSLRLPVDFDGPVVGENFQMTFDTGATFTTLDRESLERLGISIPNDAPRITLRTANGKIETPLVLVDAVWLGDEPIEWVTIAVCDSCANPPAVGLLGLNVMQHFRVSIDHERGRVELSKRRRAFDRALDIGQWLAIRSVATQRFTGSVEVALTATNASRRLIEEAVVDLTCGDESFAIQIDDIPARGERTTKITLPRGTDCSQQKIEVARGRWQLDRF